MRYTVTLSLVDLFVTMSETPHNQLLEYLRMEILFCDVGNDIIYASLSNPIRIITELDSILHNFDVPRIRALLNDLDLNYVDYPKYTEYISKVRLYLDNRTDDYYYYIYKFKCNNRITERMVSGLKLSLHIDDELIQHERNTDLIFDLMIQIDHLLYEAVLDQAVVQLKLSEFNSLILGHEVMQYKSKVQRYLDNYVTWSPIDRLLQYFNIYS